jgi:hypothetical protein
MYLMKIYVPWDEELRSCLIEAHHNLLTVGHLGIKQMIELLKRGYWRPDMDKDVERYVGGCEMCQRTKPEWWGRAAPLRPNAIPQWPWEVILWDVIRPLLLSKGKNGILIIINRFTKRMITEVINMELSSEGAARIMRDRVFWDHGLLMKVISDHGPQFVSGFMKELYHLLRIEGNPLMAYHPQTDDQTEQANQEIEQYLQIFINHRQDNRMKWIPITKFSYSDKQNSATGASPFYLKYGQHPQWGGEIKKRKQEPFHPGLHRVDGEG